MKTRRAQVWRPAAKRPSIRAKSWRSFAAFAWKTAAPDGSTRLKLAAIVATEVSTRTGSSQRWGSTAFAPPSPPKITGSPADASGPDEPEFHRDDRDQGPQSMPTHRVGPFIPRRLLRFPEKLSIPDMVESNREAWSELLTDMNRGSIE